MTSAMETRRSNVLRKGHAHITDAICAPCNWLTPMTRTTRRCLQITAILERPRSSGSSSPGVIFLQKNTRSGPDRFPLRNPPRHTAPTYQQTTYECLSRVVGNELNMRYKRESVDAIIANDGRRTSSH